jgi:Tfp pilus assembly protein PilF
MDSQTLFHTAQQFFLAGRYQESIKAFTEIIEGGTETEIVFLSRGVGYLKSGQAYRAIDDFGKVITINCNNVRAYFYRGTAYMALEDSKNAIRDFDKTIELKPDHGAAFFARGSAYARMGNRFEATRNIRTAIVLSEANMQNFSDTFGLFRTQFNKAMAILEDKENAPSIDLTVDEINTVRTWLEERDQ